MSVGSPPCQPTMTYGPIREPSRFLIDPVPDRRRGRRRFQAPRLVMRVEQELYLPNVLTLRMFVERAANVRRKRQRLLEYLSYAPVAGDWWHWSRYPHACRTTMVLWARSEPALDVEVDRDA